jgi:hypothetical protein
MENGMHTNVGWSDRWLRLISLGLALLAWVTPVQAASPTEPPELFPPSDYFHAQPPETREMLLYFTGDEAHLIVNASWDTLHGTTDQWFGLPLQALPIRVGEEDCHIFEGLYEYFRMSHFSPGQEPPPPAGMPADAGSSPHSAHLTADHDSLQAVDPNSGQDDPSHPGLAVFPQIQLSTLAVVPLRLNAQASWMAVNEFMASLGPVQHLQSDAMTTYPVDGAAYLAIKPLGMPSDPLHKPLLHFVFRSDRVSVPLRYIGGSRFLFNVYLYTVTDMAMQPDALKKLGFREVTAYPAADIRKVANGPLKKIFAGQSGFVTEFEGYGFNGWLNEKPILCLPGDPLVIR